MMSLRRSLQQCRVFTTTTSIETDSAISHIKSKFRSDLDPDKALEMYNNLNITELPEIASRIALNQTAKLLAKSGRLADVETLIESHKSNPNITQESFLSSLIRSYGLAGMTDNAYRLYQQMEELGTPRSSISFNELLVAYNESKKFDQVPKLFDEIPTKYGFSADKISYGILIRSLCMKNKSEAVLSVLKEMEEKNIEITAITYATVLYFLYKKKDVHLAEQMWKQMTEKGIIPDVTLYNVRVRNAHYEKVEDGLALIEEMKTKGLKPDIVTYNYLLTCYLKHRRMEDAKKLYESLESNGCSPEASTFELYISHLCKRKHYKSAYFVFKDSVDKDRGLGFLVLKKLVEGLASSSQTKEAKEVVRIMKQKSSDKLLDSWNQLEVELDQNKYGGNRTQKPQRVNFI
ncbi:hypothetical protein ACHQM5_020600 [Ranunculus cassubicifolius]